MKCPRCGSLMLFHELLDEKSDGSWITHCSWQCRSCGHRIEDYDDDFEWPPESPE